MTVEQMRSEISKEYGSDQWKEKCKKMKTRQVVAIYFSFLQRNIEKSKNASKIVKKQEGGNLPCDKGNYRQMNLYDYFGGRMVAR